MDISYIPGLLSSRSNEPVVDPPLCLISIGEDGANGKALPGELHWLLLRSFGISEVLVVSDDENVGSGQCQPGHLFLRPAGSTDTWYWSEPGKTICVGIHPSHFRRVSSMANGTQYGLSLARKMFFEDSFLAETVHRMFSENESDGAASAEYLGALANAIVFHLLYQYSGKDPAGTSSATGLTPNRLKRVIAYISENMNRVLSVEELADMTGLSSYYFCRLFKQSTGMTPHGYVILQRILRAQRLLCETDASITEIGAHLGFSTPSHFTWTFRKIIGTTPVLYRRQKSMLHDRSNSVLAMSADRVGDTKREAKART